MWKALLQWMRVNRKSRSKLWYPHLSLELLEKRILLNNYLWVGAKTKVWSDPTNWVDTGTGKVAVTAPGASDTVEFNPSKKAGTFQGNNVDSTMNLGFSFGFGTVNFPGQVKGVTIDGFTGKIHLMDDLVVTASFVQKSGTIDGKGDLNLLGKETWSGGKIEGSGLLVIGDQKANGKFIAGALTISPGSTKAVNLGRSLGVLKTSQVTWASGNITLTTKFADVEITEGATFKIQTSSDVTGDTEDNGNLVPLSSLEQFPTLTNLGTIDVAANSSGSLDVELFNSNKITLGKESGLDPGPTLHRPPIFFAAG